MFDAHRSCFYPRLTAPPNALNVKEVIQVLI